jgi:hypothetical protein
VSKGGKERGILYPINLLSPLIYPKESEREEKTTETASSNFPLLDIYLKLDTNYQLL